MLGVTFLAAIFSALLAIAETIRRIAVHDDVDVGSQPLWIAGSCAAASIPGKGFGRLRVRAVDTAHLQILIAVNGRKQGLFGSAATPSPAGAEN